MNSKMTELTGYSLEEVLGRLHYEMFQEECDWESARKRKRRRNEGRSERYELEAKRKDESRFWALVHASPFRTATGEIVGSLGCYTDVDDHRRAEEQLRRSHKMEAVGQLAAGIAHDFNNILTIIGGHTGLLLANTDADTSLSRSLKQVAAASDRAAELTSKLLAFSRRQTVKLKTFDLNEAILEFETMICSATGEDVTARLELQENLPRVLADTGMIGQILTNFAMNARDAMPRGGEFIVRTKAVQITETGRTGDAEAVPGEYVCMEAVDTGEGMSEEIRERIFDPFFSTKPTEKGTGMGLASVYGIVKQHQGWIEVESEPGEGAVFRVYFPVHESGHASDVLRPDSSVASAHGETILLVEDEEQLLMLNRQILENHGYCVLTAENGSKALEVWRDHREEIDMLLTDVVMPGGVTGCDLARDVLSSQPDLPVVFVSGYSSDVLDGGTSIEVGKNFLPKPFRADALLNIVGAKLAMARVA